MKKIFELTPELFKRLLESDKESFIAKFNETFYLSAQAIRCIFPLLPDDEARKAFFLAGELPEKTDGVLESLNSYFSAFDCLFENKKYELIIQLGHTNGAGYLYQKGFKDFLIEYACKHENKRWVMAHVFYEEHEWLLLNDYLAEELGRCSGFFPVSGVLAFQEKYGKDSKKTMNAVYSGNKCCIGGVTHPSDLYRRLTTDKSWYMEHSPEGHFAAWMDWGKIPDAKALLIWYYKNIGDEQFKAEIVQLFAQDGKIIAALKNPNFPTKLAEIEEALNS